MFSFLFVFSWYKSKPYWFKVKMDLMYQWYSMYLYVWYMYVLVI